MKGMSVDDRYQLAREMDLYEPPVRTQWYAVRCCCRPKTLFGFILLEDMRGSTTTTVIFDKYGKQHQIELKVIDDCKTSMRNGFTSTKRRRETAVYSDDRPIEFWREIPTFVEVIASADQSRP